MLLSLEGRGQPVLLGEGAGPIGRCRCGLSLEQRGDGSIASQRLQAEHVDLAQGPGDYWDVPWIRTLLSSLRPLAAGGVWLCMLPHGPGHLPGGFQLIPKAKP